MGYWSLLMYMHNYTNSLFCIELFSLGSRVCCMLCTSIFSHNSLIVLLYYSTNRAITLCAFQTDFLYHKQETIVMFILL